MKYSYWKDKDSPNVSNVNRCIKWKLKQLKLKPTNGLDK